MPMETDEIIVEEMVESDIAEAVLFIGKNMNAEEGEYAEETMRFHFGCRQGDHNDGRDYYVWRNEGAIVGVVGLHNYIWGPKSNVWLGWFAVKKTFRRNGVGTELMKCIEKIALEKGYEKFYIETYSSKTFDAANEFYRKVGFEEVGQVPGYMPDGADMIIYHKSLV